MTRARCVTAGADMATRFETVRRSVLMAERDPSSLREEIISMRNKVSAAHPVKNGYFDLKHSPGGMIDAEFVMQYLILQHARLHQDLLANAGNIALLERAESLGLIPEPMGHAAADAYRSLRKAQHRARLNEASTQVPPETLSTEQQAIAALWKTVFTAGTG